MNKITCVRVGGKRYNTVALTTATMQEFVRDVNVTENVAAVAKKYGIVEVK